MDHRPFPVLAALVLVPLLALAGCGTNGAAPGAAGGGDGRLKVVTSVAPITSIVANVAGGLADIDGVVPGGEDSHTFEPPPSVAVVLSEADIVFVNGLMLEESLLALAQTHLKEGARIVALGDEALPESEYIYDFAFPEEEGKPNPHLWTDPTYAKRYADITRRELAEMDRANAAAYDENYRAFAARIDEFDRAMRESFATIAPERRKLLTYHDAYPYFARTYGWEVIGAIQVRHFEEPTPREVAALIEQVRELGIPAIFGSEVFPSPVLAQIGREAGVRYVDVLRDDELPGQPGDPDHSWLGMMRLNLVTMVEALGGDASALRDFDVSDVAPDTANYAP